MTSAIFSSKRLFFGSHAQGTIATKPWSISLVSEDSSIVFVAHINWPGPENFDDELYRRWGDSDKAEFSLLCGSVECCGSPTFVAKVLREWYGQFDSPPEVWVYELAGSIGALQALRFTGPVFDLSSAFKLIGEALSGDPDLVRKLSPSPEISITRRGSILAQRAFHHIKKLIREERNQSLERERDIAIGLKSMGRPKKLDPDVYPFSIGESEV